MYMMDGGLELTRDQYDQLCELLAPLNLSDQQLYRTLQGQSRDKLTLFMERLDKVGRVVGAALHTTDGPHIFGNCPAKHVRDRQRQLFPAAVP